MKAESLHVELKDFIGLSLFTSNTGERVLLVQQKEDSMIIELEEDDAANIQTTLEKLIGVVEKHLTVHLTREKIESLCRKETESL